MKCILLCEDQPQLITSVAVFQLNLELFYGLLEVRQQN